MKKKHNRRAGASLRTATDGIDLRAGATNPPDTLISAASVDLVAAPSEGKLPTFSIHAYTGEPMQANFFYPIVVDLGGLKSGRSKLPILLNHEPDRIVGQADKIDIDHTGVKLSGAITGSDADALKVITHAKNGFEWQASIGAAVVRREFLESGKKATVNGREVAGPMFIAREATLKEVSFVAVGADPQTSASVAAGHTSKEVQMDPFETWLQAKGFDPATLAEGSKQYLKAQFDAEQNTRQTPNAAQVNGGTKTPADIRMKALIQTEEEKEQRNQSRVDITAKALQDFPGQLEFIKAMAEQAQKADWAPEKFELELLRATRPQGAPTIFARRNDEVVTANVIEAALCLAGGIESPEKEFSEQTLDAAAGRFRHGLGLGELLMLFARRNGHDALSTRDVRPLLRAAFSEPHGGMLRASAPSTMSLPGILSNVANKFLKLGFDAVESTWRTISAIRPVRNFQQITSYALTGDFKYVEVPKGGKLEHGSVGEETYTNQASVYARMFAIDYRDIVNDDLNALTQVPRRLGRGAALTFNEIFWTKFLSEHTTGRAFFPTNGSKGNYLAGATPGTNDSRMNIEGLGRAETLFFNQTDPDGNPLGVMPKILLVPNALNATASTLMRSTEIRDNTANTQTPTMNPHSGKFDVARSSYLSNSAMGGGHSTTAYYLLPDPNDLVFIESVFLNGVESPTVETADADFNTLGIQMRGMHAFGVELQEYRAAVKSKGAA